MKPKVNNRLIAGLLAGRNLMGLGFLLLTGSAAIANTVYWDTNYTVAGSGNNGGSWEGVNWTTDSAGLSATSIWTNGDSVVFSAGTDGTATWHVALTSTITTPSIIWEEPFASGNDWRSINGGTINIGGGILNSSALGFAPGNGYDVNINSVLAGSGGLTIAAHGDATSNGGGGGGAEFRLGSNNTFSGGLTITSGLVSWFTDANLGDTSNVITLNGGGLLYTNDPALTTSRTIKIGAAGGTIRLYGGKDVTCTTAITNATGVATTTLRRTDGGTLKLVAPGAGFVGTYINGGGSTQLNTANADWSSTDFVVAGGNLNPNGTGTAVVNSINSTADVIIDNDTTLNVDTGAITLLTAHWYKTNTGTLGKLTSSSGTLTITNGAATGDLTGTDHQIRVQIVNSGATPVALVKNNNNSLFLNEANTYSGGTTINGGRVQPNTATSFGTGTVTVSNGGQAFLTASAPHANNFTINGNGTTEGVGTLGALRFANVSSVSGTVNVASASRITTYSASDTGTIAGPLTGSSALEKTGAGTLVITGNASGYTGTATLNSGTLKLDSTLGGSLVVNSGTSMTGEGTITGGLTLAANANFFANGNTIGALSTTDLTVNGLNLVNLAGLPAIPGSPMNVINYSGTLTMTGTVEDNFDLVGSASYRGVPTFADTGTAITLTVPAGADLVWRGQDPTNPTFWDINTTANWKNGATDPDKFFTGDNVLFDDTGATRTVDMSGMLSPGTVTFNNSIGNDYTIAPNGGGFGFTGPTNIVKNGTGTATIQGYSHNYTGTVTINDGVLQGNGNYEVLGNSSGVTINDSINGGGQLNVNGLNLGNGTRHYSVTIAGDGPDGLGAITNTGGDVYENAGMLNLTLSADASVGSSGGRFDFGRSGGAFGSITGNGFTLTKVGGGTVCIRAAAPNITYVIEGGTLKFEDYDTGTGPNALAVNFGTTLQSYGDRTFGNTLNFDSSTTLDNDGGGSQTWTGPLNMIGFAGETVNLSARNGAITLSGVISGAPNININGGNILYLTGSASNTYGGTTTIVSTGQLVLAKSGGAVSVPGDLFLSSTGTRAIASTTLDNQFGANSVLRFAANGDSRLELKGTTQTVAGIDNSTATPGYNCIQHSEFGAPAAVDGISDLTVNVADTMFYTFNGVVRDQGGRVNLVKSGLGTQALLGGGIDFTGTTNVTAGRLILNSDDSWTSGLNISPGAVCEVNITNTGEPYENRYVGFTLTGGGTYVKTGPGTMSMGWGDGTPTIMATVAMDPDASIEIGEGTMRFDYGRQTSWTNNKSDMFISSGATLDLWDNNNDGIIVDSLNGSGSIIRSNYGQTGNLTVGVDNGDETPAYFSGVISNASGKTNLIKKGTGTQILAGVNTYTGNTMVDDGILELAGTGSLKFAVTDASSNMITGTGTATLDGSFNIDTTAVTVTSNVWTLVDVGILDPASTFGETFTLGAGWTEVSGVWTKIEGNNKWTFTEATGELELTPNNTYAVWINGFFTGVTDPAIIGGAADPDNDGIDNAVEMVLGGNPATGMDAALLPTIEMVSNPVSVPAIPAGNYLLFTYRRTDLSVGANVVATCQTDADLVAPWTTVTGTAPEVIQVDDNYTWTNPAAATPTDRVRVYVPSDANTRLFGRLDVVVP